MSQAERFSRSSRKCIPVPVMIQLLELLEDETQGDAILAGVSRTLSQAIAELAALQRTAVEVAREETEGGQVSAGLASERRRLC